MKKKTYTVKAFWDDEAKVWCAEGVDVPGLCTEASTWNALIKKLNVMVPEMLEANGIINTSKDLDIPFSVTGEMMSVAHYRAMHCA